MKLTKVTCPQCGGMVEIDKQFEFAKCPFCQSSFVIEGIKRRKEETLLVTTTSEVLPEEVNSELFVHTLFGWDFKQKKFYRSQIGSPYVTGYGLGGSCEMVQLTFERNMKAPWCTEELLKKEKEFFAVRAQYINEFMNQQKSNMTKPKVAAFPKPFRMGMIFLPIGATFLSFIFLLIGLTEPEVLFLAFMPIPILLIAVAVEIFFAKQGGKVKRNRQARFDEEFKESSKKITELNNRMNEIAKWAGDHMEQKFGYKISPLVGEAQV